MKITRNTTVEQIKDALNLNAKLVEENDKELFEQFTYTSKAMNNGETVSKKDLVDLLKSVIKSLGDKFIEPVLAEEKSEETVNSTDNETAEVEAENSVKAKTKLKSKKSGAKTEETPVEEDKAEQSEETVEEKKVDEKSAKKGSVKKNSVVSVLEDKESGMFNVTAFAEEFTDAEGVKYVRADDIKTMEDLTKEDLDNIVFAFYWNKKQLRQGYMQTIPSIKTPKEFPNDVDLASCMWVSEENIVTYVISLYTEAPYALTPDDFEVVDGVRFLTDIEYQIYRVVTE